MYAVSLAHASCSRSQKRSATAGGGPSLRVQAGRVCDAKRSETCRSRWRPCRLGVTHSANSATALALLSRKSHLARAGGVG